MRAVLPAGANSRYRCNGPDPIHVLIHLPVPAATRRFVVTDDLGGTFLRSVHATISTAGSSASTITAVKDPDGTNDPLLTTDTTIDSGDTTSYDADTQHVVDDSGDPQVNYMERGDVIEVTVTSGTGADDPVVLLEFGPNKIPLSP